MSASRSSSARARPKRTRTPAPASTTCRATIGWSSRIGRDDQRQPVRERLAHGVVAAVGDTASRWGSSASWGTHSWSSTCGRHCPRPGARGGQDQLRPVGELLGGPQHRGVEAAARLAVEGAQRHQHPARAGVEPLPGEVGPRAGGARRRGRRRRSAAGNARPRRRVRGWRRPGPGAGRTAGPSRPGAPHSASSPAIARHPLPDLREVRERPGHLGRGARRRRPGQTEPRGTSGPARACWSATSTSGRKESTAASTPGSIAWASGMSASSHRNRSAATPRRSRHRVPRRPAVGRVVAGRGQPRPVGQQPRQGLGRSGPGDLVPARGEFGGDGDRRVDVPGQRRDDEQHPHPTTASPAGVRRSRPSGVSHSPVGAPPSRTSCPRPGRIRSVQSGAWRPVPGRRGPVRSVRRRRRGPGSAPGEVRRVERPARRDVVDEAGAVQQRVGGGREPGGLARPSEASSCGTRLPSRSRAATESVSTMFSIQAPVSGRLDQDEPGDEVGAGRARCAGRGCRRSCCRPGGPGVVEVERGEQGPQVPDGVAAVVAGGRAFGAAVAAQVVQDDVVPGGGDGDRERAVEAGEVVDDQAVQEDDGGAGRGRRPWPGSRWTWKRRERRR